MKMNWEDVKRDWISGTGISLTEEEVLPKLLLLEQKLGIDYLNRIRIKPGIIPNILDAIILANQITIVENCVGFENIIARIKLEEKAAYSELKAAYLLFRPNTQLEFGPTARIKNSEKKPDIRIRMDDDVWTYVEVATPNESVLQKKAQKLLEIITTKINSIVGKVVIDCLLIKEPTDSEIDKLCVEITSCLDTTSSQIRKIMGLAIIAVNPSDLGQVIIQDYGEPNIPRIAMSSSIIENGIAQKTITVRLPFEDKRAERFLTLEARQLPKESPGLIMFDMTSTVLGIPAWYPLLLKRLQPNQHTRVSSICLFLTNYIPNGSEIRWITNVKYIQNSHAKLMIPEWIKTRLESY